MPVRLAHFSDVHLTAPKLGWRVRDLFGKRGTGWVNVRLMGRAHRFRYANEVVAAMLGDFRTRGYDQLVFSGDATTMAFDSEMTESARRLGVWDQSLPPAICVPGNHDLYTFGATRRGTFEFAFSAWQQGERADDAHTYPFARKVGHVWLIALNSAKPNVLPWDATGRVGEAQLGRLRALCAKLDAGPRVIVSHYPLLTRGRRPEARWHRLIDWGEARDAAAACGVGLWLHGHKHAWYVLTPGDDLPFNAVCVGSSAQEKLWGYHEYEIDGNSVRALRRVYDPATGAFADADRFALELPG